MKPIVIGLALFAAALHATWNALLRSGSDRLWAMTVMSYATTVAALPVVLLLPLPDRSAWPYLIASSLLQIGYSLFLTFAYRVGDLGQVYPVVRGSVPIMVTVGAFAFSGQAISAQDLGGVALVSGGIAALALGRDRAPSRSLVFALATALFIASYVTVDGIGVRAAGDARAYAAWIFLLYGGLMPLTYFILRGRFPIDILSGEASKAFAGGIISLVSYAATISALALGRLGPVSALRETSVVFSIIVGRIALREKVTVRRVLACCIVAAGAAIIGLAA